jgi:hypothetical protein
MGMGYFLYEGRVSGNKWYYALGIGTFFGGKVLTNYKLNKNIRESHIEEYAFKATNFDKHLKYVENEIKAYDKFVRVVNQTPTPEKKE